MVQREQQRDIGAIGKPKQIRLFDAVLVHEFLQVPDKPVQSERRRASRALSMPSCIQGIDVPDVLKVLDLVPEIRPVFPVAMEQDQRNHASRFLIRQLKARFF